jgi:hypothetical protein
VRRAWPTLAFALAAILYWFVASTILVAPEPWDSPRYPVALSVAIGLVAVASYAAPRHAGAWAVIAIVAQIPVLLTRSAPGPLLAVGLLTLAIECVPALAAAFLAARLRGVRG